MRILLTHFDTPGALLVRQPLFAALADAGQTSGLLVPTSMVALARCAVPQATILTIDDDHLALPGDLDTLRPERLVHMADRWSPAAQAVHDACPDATLVVGSRCEVPECVSGARQVVHVPSSANEHEKAGAFAVHLLGRDVALAAPHIEATAGQIEAATQALGRLGVEPGQYVVARVGHDERTALRNWTVDGWGQLLARWQQEHDRRFIFVGAAGDAAVTEAVRERMGAAAAATASAIGVADSMDELVGLTHLSQGYVGRGGDLLHLAAALGKPTLAVLGGGDWPHLTPTGERAYLATVGVGCAGCDWACPFATSHCVKQVPVAALWRGVVRFEADGLRERTEEVLAPTAALSATMLREAQQRNATQARKLATATAELAQTRAAGEAAVTRARTEADTSLLQQEAAFRHKLAAVRTQAAQAAARAVDAEAVMERMKADYKVAMRFLGQKISECARLRDQGQLVADLQAQIVQLRQEVLVQQQRVRDLQASRWRKLGLKLGAARRTAWEAPTEGEHAR